MKDKIKELLINGDVRLPMVLLSDYKKLNIDEISLIIIIYLLNQKNLEFNPSKISEDLNMKLLDVMVSIDNLTKNNLIKIETKKIDNVRKDIINLDSLYDKLLYLVIEEESVDNKDKGVDIFTTFESEFGRTLSPRECEIINSWIDSYNKEIIIEALNEAVYNGVFKLNYIDKILYEWSKQGIKTSKDIINHKKKFTNKKEEKKDLYDYNWLEDESNT